MDKKNVSPKFNEKSIVPTEECKLFIINNTKEKQSNTNNININISPNNKNTDNETNDNINSNIINDNDNDNDNHSDVFEDLFFKYSSLFNDEVLGRFPVLQKINIVNKLNIILFNKIKKELQLQLKRKQLENQLLKIRNGYKDKLIKKKKLYSLIQQKMLRDYNFKRKLKDIRKKLMDEKINILRDKNLTYIMKSYGIYNESKSYR